MSSRLDLTHGYGECVDLHTIYVFETDTFEESSLTNMIAYLSSYDIMKILKENKEKTETTNITKNINTYEEHSLASKANERSARFWNSRNNRRSSRR
jgi:hypothetical protein